MSDSVRLATEHDFNSLIQDLLDHTPSVIYVKDVDFRYLLINRQFESLFHVSRADIAGKTDFDLFTHELAEIFRANDLRVRDTGESLAFEETAPQDDGLHQYFSLKFPLRHADGTIYAIAGISTDITDQLRAQHEIDALHLRQHLILDSVRDGIVNLDLHGCLTFLNLAAERMLRRDSSAAVGIHYKELVAHHARSMNPSGATSIQRVLEGGGAIAVQQGSFRRSDGTTFPVEFSVVPIMEHQMLAGAVITFRDLTERQRQLAVEQEILTANRIQNAMTPRQLPSLAGIEFAALSMPCSQACGDYFDFIPCENESLGIAVGDVSGHGLGAAIEMVETRAVLRTTMLTESDPARCLSRVNQMLAADLLDDMFVTLFLGILNPRDRTLTYAAAGHDALLLCANGDVRRLESTGAALGLHRSAEFQNGEAVILQPGDILLIATDGISETVSPTMQLFGRHRLTDFLRQNQQTPASEILQRLLETVEGFRADSTQRDDMTAVLLKILPMS